MGLDMYLTAKQHISKYDFDEDGCPYEGSDSHLVEEALKKTNTPCPEGLKPTNLDFEIGYWRKANQIHKWFVNNCAEGIDDCEQVYVSKENLEELLGICRKVLEASELVDAQITNGYTFEGSEKIPILTDGQAIKDHSVAEKLLPSADGFFFGGTDYDEYYYQDIEYTIEVLEKALKLKNMSIYYQASW